MRWAGTATRLGYHKHARKGIVNWEATTHMTSRHNVEMTEAEHAGDVAHPDHQQWLLALGRANYASQLLAGTAVDVLRVHCGVDFWTLLPDTLGNLIKRLAREDQQPDQIPGLATWLAELDQALIVRNDLASIFHGVAERWDVGVIAVEKL